VKRTHHRAWWIVAGLLAAAATLIFTAPVMGQERPPISGETGTIALPGTVDQEYAGAHAIAVTIVDGARHVFHVAENLFVHDGHHGGNESLAGLRMGSAVPVRYTGTPGEASLLKVEPGGTGGLVSTEGIVVGIDRRKAMITIRFSSLDTQTFELSSRASVDTGSDWQGADAQVIVSYADESGRQAVQFFRRVS